MNGSSFFVALLRAALVIFTAFFLGACAEEEKGGDNNEANNGNEVNNIDNGDNNDGNNTENPVCDGKQDNPHCSVNQECTDTEFWHPQQGVCVEKCDYANCYVDEGQECDALTGNCFWPEIDPIENPCAEWEWLRPNERAWTCNSRPGENIGLRLEERPDGCFIDSDLVINGFYLPNEIVHFFPDRDMFEIIDPPFEIICIPMEQ